MLTIRPEPVWHPQCLLGEGPVWLAEEQAVRFVDIKRGLLHRWVPASGAAETSDVGGEPSFIVPVSDGRLLIGSGHDLCLLEEDRVGAPVARLEMPAHNRINDATVDPSGRLWFGTMDNSERQPTGSIWCLDRGTLHQSDSRAVITNGPAISTDGTTLYHVNSGERVIWRCTIGDSPYLGAGEVFVRLGNDDGLPDGIVVDGEDCLWVALWDGWGVRRYAPDGTQLLHIPFPCASVPLRVRYQACVRRSGPENRLRHHRTDRAGCNCARRATTRRSAVQLRRARGRTNPARSSADMSNFSILGDWGTTRLRLWGIDRGEMTCGNEGPGIGALTLSPAATLRAAMVPFLAVGGPPDRIVLCGMAGARNGLHEASYAECPANADAWASKCARLDFDGVPTTIAKEAFRLADAKLPFRCRFIVREGVAV